jgi:hypothetical protein
MTTTREQIGQILLRRGLIDNERLERALLSQREFGGRLGTNLVELRYVSVDDVGRALALQQSVPLARHVDMFAATRGLLDKITGEVCDRYRVFPLSLERNVLQLAMMDPLDLTATDELSFMLSVTIKPWVVPEIRLIAALERRFGIPRKKRFAEITTEMAPVPRTGEGHKAGEGQQAVEATGGEVEVDFELEIDVEEPSPGPKASDAPDLELVYLDDDKIQRAPASSAGSGEIAIPDDLFEDAAVRARPKDAAAPTEAGGEEDSDFELTVQEPDSVANVTATIGAMERAETRDAVIELLVRPYLSQVTLSVLFVARGESAVGLRAFGTDVSALRLKALSLPLTTPSLLQESFASRQVVRGTVEGDPVQQVIARHLRSSGAEEVWIAPVCLGERVVNLLCLHVAAGVRMVDSVGDDLTLMCVKAAECYARLIRESKQQR